MTDHPSERASAEQATGGQYVVIARRYRPQTFDQLVGQQHVAHALQQAITSDRVGHAYLFTGARGVGKTSAARILAKALNCVDGPTPTPCNACEVCHSISTGEDVDVLEIDGASNRGIDEIRQLRQNVAIRPSRVRYKIYIIDEVHMLTKEAFNALLKTLEEPPEHVKFIFATTEPNKIPITILSRCQRFDFAGIGAAAIENRLTQIAEAEGVQIEPAAVQILACRAAGSMRDSQSLLEQLLAVAEGTITADAVNSLLGIAPAERISALVDRLASRDAAAALAELDAALASGVDVGQLLDQLLGYFRDAMTAAAGCGPGQMLFALPTERDQVADVAAKLGLTTILAMVQILDQTAARMRLSLHGRTLVEMAIVRICQLDNLDELSSLIADLREGVSPPAATDGRTAGTAKKNDSRPAASLPVERLTNSEQQATSVLPSATAKPTNEQPAEQAATEPSVSLPLTDQTAAELWQKVILELGDTVAGSAAYADRITAGGSDLLVASFAASNNFYMELCQRPDNRGRIEEVLGQVYGQPIRLTLESHADLESTKPAAPTPLRISKREQQQEVAERPFVNKALTLFDVEPGQFRYTPPENDS